MRVLRPLDGVADRGHHRVEDAVEVISDSRCCPFMGRETERLGQEIHWFQFIRAIPRACSPHAGRQRPIPHGGNCQCRFSPSWRIESAVREVMWSSSEVKRIKPITGRSVLKLD